MDFILLILIIIFAPVILLWWAIAWVVLMVAGISIIGISDLIHKK